MRPEVLAPAGDEDCLRAAIRAGADAVYFGVQGFNARARAKNFALDELPRIFAQLHASGVKGYVTLNTLIFDHELADLERTIRACAAAGADAIIVQDLGVLQLARAVAPELPVHASTQMTCTDAASVSLAAQLGASRVVVARELSLEDIAKIRAQSPVELEVFVHGALCVAYSGQCLTSEAIGGRSANRGACAQACRLPYDLVVDGDVRDLGDVAHLLSPEDLEASALVPELARLGVSSLKIEGRLKGPAYVASTVRLYRAAVDALGDVSSLRRDALQTYSRGSGPGFLAGVNHQRLVDGRTCEHRGLEVGTVVAVRRGWIELSALANIAKGDGLFIEGGRAGRGERGGRVWDIDGNRVWLGPDVAVDDVVPGRRVFKNDDPALEKRVFAENEREPHREPIDVIVRGSAGAPLVLEARSTRGLQARVESDVALEIARNRPLDVDTLRDKIGKLGDTPYALRDLDVQIANLTLPLSSLNRARRALADALVASGVRSWSTTSTTASDLLDRSVSMRPAPPPGLFVLCRTLEQAKSALSSGADGVWLDFLALTGTGVAFKELKDAGAKFVGVAPPRIQKPGEEKIGAFLLGLEPDGYLVRSLGALDGGEGGGQAPALREGGGQAPALRVGDFSLNATNRLTVAELLRHVDAFVPSFDLDEQQLLALLAHVGAHAELVVHHPMPLFHMEHCVFAALLSDGKDFRTCGRPCEHHTVSLRDRVGMDHPVEADVGCRNTVFHARAQSAAALIPKAQAMGVRRFRIELVRESAEDVARIVKAYRSVLDGGSTERELRRTLAIDGGYGVVKGSLRVL